MSEQIPIVEVYKYDQSYEMLKSLYDDSQVTVHVSRPSSPLQRVFTNVFGFLALSTLTFLLTDVLRGAATGTRPPVWWFFYGPWYYITGAPLINNIVDMHRFFIEMHDRDKPGRTPDPDQLAEHLANCDAEYESNKEKCCDSLDGTFDPTKTTSQCEFSTWDDFWGSSNRYQSCAGDANGLKEYCKTFDTDDSYNRAKQMYEQHPLLFDVFYLWNYGTLPMGQDIWDIISPF